jgi:hypothetical protein
MILTLLSRLGYATVSKLYGTAERSKNNEARIRQPTTNNTRETLIASCKAVAEELERVGKKLYHECGECKNCKENLNAEGEVVICSCEAKSDGDDEYNVTESGDICEHGDLDRNTRANEPCDDFDPVDGVEDETYYESMYDRLNEQFDIEDYEKGGLTL